MRLGVIGCGKMGTALVQGGLRAGVLDAAAVVGYDSSSAALAQFSSTCGVGQASHLADLTAQVDAILLATKPQGMATVLADLRAALGEKPCLVVSIAAGVSLQTLEAGLSPLARVVRVMPNTPALVGQGAAAYALGSGANAADAEWTQRLLSGVGLSVRVSESLLDVVTGLSGSGPAYVFLIIEALADGAVKNGLPRAEALQLAAQTVMGAAALMLESGEHPAVLKEMVTSPGGTTIAGLAVLERQAVRGALIDAVSAATERSQALSRLSTSR